MFLIGSRHSLFYTKHLFLTLLVFSFIFLQLPHRGPEAGPPPPPYPSHSLRRLPQCPPVHLSHPVPLSLTLSLSPGPALPRPPLPPPHIHVAPRGASFRSASRHNSCRMVMVSDCLVPSLGNILFDDVSHCNLYQRQPIIPNQRNYVVHCTFRRVSPCRPV